MSQVLVEVLPNIQACYMYITLPSNNVFYQKISVGQSECSIELQDGRVILLKMSKGTYLVPNSATGVTQAANILTVRVQISERTSLISSLSGDILSDSSTKFLDTLLNTSLSDTLVSAHCKKCPNCVFTKVKFRRVMPLPSVDWDHSSENWFCHLHGEHGQKLKPASLQPQHDECFYTELYFLMHNSMMECINAKCDDGMLKCSGCGTLLGENTDLLVKIWALNLKWLTQQGEVIYDRNSSEILLSLFHSIDKDNFGVNCQLVLEVQTVPKKYMYMVTMNTNQKLLVSDVSNLTSCEPVVQKLCLEDKDISLKKIYAIKLLYLIKEGEDSQTGQWVDDIGVHIIPCSSLFFHEVKTMLENSTYFLPDNVKVIENMNIGYIVK
ncbi:E3 ubiquitin-protein ligase E3D-like [Cherax quadricarinatus]|uniref:E3 ubiquitin-protein ligase E3D-like n=1 Tax=Cherax quadricarinatus TaxID=27406 RepID=UPI00387EE1A1